jgi:2-methylcitrate dehydratase
VPSTTSELAEFTSGLSTTDVPPEVVDRIKAMLLDQLGVAQFVVDHTPWGRAVERYATEQAPRGGPCQVLGSSATTSPAAAALANGTLTMGFEFEDMHTEGTGHPFSIVFPAALAAAEALDVDGETFVASLVAGYEVGVRASLGLDRASEPWTKRGLYPITIFGVFGAAAAAARALELDSSLTAQALGIAGSHAFGTMQAHKEGTMTRRLHAGRAAEIGVTAAQLARQGITGPLDVLDGEFGIYQAFGGSQPDFAPITRGLGDAWATDGSWLKFYPCNGLFQAPLDGLLSIMSEQQLRTDDVVDVEVRIPLATRLHERPSAVTPVNAQFSLHYCMALALVHGRPEARHFLDGTVGDPAVVSAMDRVRVSLDPTMSQQHADSSRPGTVVVSTQGGEQFERHVAHPKGHPRNSMGWEDIESKFSLLVDDVVTPADAARMRAAIADIDRTPRLPRLSRA